MKSFSRRQLLRSSGAVTASALLAGLGIAPSAQAHNSGGANENPNDNFYNGTSTPIKYKCTVYWSGGGSYDMGTKTIQPGDTAYWEVINPGSSWHTILEEVP